MGLCFVCDIKLFGERTRVCSSITPHSNCPYPEKLAELLGEEFVVIVTPADHMCKKCTSLLVHMDKLENDLKLVKTAMVSYIQKRYGLLPADQTVRTLDVVNGHLKTDDLEVGQKKVPSGLTVRESPSAQPPLKMMKPNPPENSNTSSSAAPSATKMKIYKCGFCTFQSKELGHVRFHMRSHMKKGGNAGGTIAGPVGGSRSGEVEKTQPVAKVVTPVPPTQKKRLYRCQVCSTSFDSRTECLDHIQKDHNQQTEERKEKKEVGNTISKNTKQEPQKTQGNQQAADSTMETDGQQAKGTVDTDMLLNDHVPSEGVAASEEQEESHDVDEGASQEKELPEQDEAIPDNDEAVPANDEAVPAHDEAVPAHDEAVPASDEAIPGQDESEQESAVQNETEQGEPMEVDQAVDSAGKEDVDMANGDGTDENKTGDLDIESMLAAIHNDNPAAAEDTQNIE